MTFVSFPYWIDSLDNTQQSSYYTYHIIVMDRASCYFLVQASSTITFYKIQLSCPRLEDNNKTDFYLAINVLQFISMFVMLCLGIFALNLK